MLIESQSLEGVLDMVIETGVVKQVFLGRSGLQAQSLEPRDSGDSQGP